MNKSREKTRTILMALGLLLQASLLPACPQKSEKAALPSQKKPTRFKLRVDVTDLGKDAAADSVYHYLAAKGVDAFENEKYAEAESCFRLAVADAEKRKIGDAGLGMLTCNLAVSEERQNKLAEADPLFKQAIKLSRADLRPGKPTLAYAMKQYSGFLRKVGRSIDADFYADNARAVEKGIDLRAAVAANTKKQEVQEVPDEPMEICSWAPSIPYFDKTDPKCGVLKVDNKEIVHFRMVIYEGDVGNCVEVDNYVRDLRFRIDTRSGPFIFKIPTDRRCRRLTGSATVAFAFWSERWPHPILVSGEMKSAPCWLPNPTIVDGTTDRVFDIYSSLGDKGGKTYGFVYTDPDTGKEFKYSDEDYGLH